MRRQMRLIDAGIARLKAGKTDYTIWDTVAPGLGIRVRTSGFRGYVFHRRGAMTARRVSLGPAALKSVEEARRECLSMQLEEDGRAPADMPAIPLFRDYVEDPWKAGMTGRWKPSTRRSVEARFRTQLLPEFGHLRLDRIAPAGVDAWFENYSITAPGNANKALAILRQILNHAVAGGLIAVNPARRTTMNPRPRLTRFLSAAEIARLIEALDHCVADRPARAPQADIIRLLLLTGCRKSEIKNLQWSEVHGNTLRLSDSKTGPRMVYLSEDARALIDRQPRNGGQFVFPSPADPGRPRRHELRLWDLARERAALPGVRLHDLRHTYASQAFMRGVPLPVVARLLGHSQVQMTMRYAHVGDRDVEAAAERIGEVVAGALAGEG